MQSGSQAAASAKGENPQKPAARPHLAVADEGCFKEPEDDEGFKFSGVPIPGRGRLSSNDLDSRLAILR